MNSIIKKCLITLPVISGLSINVLAIELTHIPLPPKMQTVALNTPYAIGEATWVGITSDGDSKSMIMNLEHGVFSDSALSSNDAVIFTYTFGTGATSFLADTFYSYKNRALPAPELNTIIPQEKLNQYRLRAMSTSHYDMITGFINRSKGNKSEDLATNGTYFNNGTWHDLPAYKNKQSDVFLTAGEKDDQFLLMSNEVGSNIYANSPLIFEVYSVKDKAKLSVNFKYNREEAYYLTAVPDYEDPYVFYHNVCNMEPDDLICSTASSYVDRCEIDKNDRTVTCDSIAERGYMMNCPLQTSKGTRNLMLFAEDNQVRMKQPFAADIVYPVQKGNYNGAKVPYFYPWVIGDQCDGALIRRYYEVLSLQRDSENSDIVTGFSTKSSDDIITAVSKLAGEEIRSDYADISSFTKVGDHYELLIFPVPKGSLYTNELINVRMSAAEKEQLLSGKP